MTPGSAAERAWFDALPGRPWWRNPVVLGLLALGTVVLLVSAWLGVRAYQAATALTSVATTVRDLRADVARGQVGSLAEPAAQIEADAARAVAATSDPVWSLAERLPVVGVDAAAVRTVALAVDGLAVGVVTPLSEVADGISPESLRPVEGRIDTAPLEAAAPVLASAAEAAAGAQATVDTLDPGRLHGPLVGPVRELQDQLGSAAGTLEQASRLAVLLPPMLGAEEPRSYLALFLNSAELRTQGGIVGSVAVISVDDGRLQLTRQAANPDVTSFPAPVLPLAPEELAITSDILGRHLQNVVLLPDTPRAGQLAAEMWRRTTGQTVDGVVAIDPVALSYVLRATGQITHPSGDVLEADTLVQRLLFDAYEQQSSPAESDDFFAGAAIAAFEALASGRGEPGRLLDAVGQGVRERRVSLWSVHPEEQAQILGTGADGALLTGGHDDAVGVFLDNTSGWKTDSFLRSSLTLQSATCTDGTVSMDVRLDLASTMPADASTLPPYVVGDGSTGVPVGSMRMRVSVYSPVGGSIDQVKRGAAFLGASGGTIAGRQVQVMSQSLAAGETASYVFTITAPDRGARVPLWSTPTTTSPGLTTATARCAAR